jgi:hypothetical protein
MGKRTWIAAAAALATAAAVTSTPASAYTSIGVQIGLPAPVYVAPPPPPPAVVYQAAPVRPGQLWVAGHWEWQGNGHVWVPGRYLRARAGYHYQQPRWQQHGERWAYYGGGWSRGDRDGDGVPNRYDRAPNNPYRR